MSAAVSVERHGRRFSRDAWTLWTYDSDRGHIRSCHRTRAGAKVAEFRFWRWVVR